MRSSISFFLAAALLGLTTASPLERRYEECKAPQQWYTCGDGYKGCCSVVPCKGPAEGVKSHCPDVDAPVPPVKSVTACKAKVSTSTTSATLLATPSASSSVASSLASSVASSLASSVTSSATPSGASSATPSYTSSASPSASPSATPGQVRDVDWKKECKEDDSDCNWAPRFFTIKTKNETYTIRNRTTQFHVQNDGQSSGARRDSIALFTNIPSSVTRCTIRWYKPSHGIFYGTFNEGAMNISTLDMGGKPFAEAVGSQDISYQNTQSFIAAEKYGGVLDLANWGKTITSAVLGGPSFDCKESELAVHFALNDAWAEGSVTVDQVSHLNQSLNGYVQRAGWFLKYE